MANINRHEYAERGFVVVSGVLQSRAIDKVLAVFLRRLSELGGPKFEDAHSPDLANLLRRERALETSIYDAMRSDAVLHDLAQLPELLAAVRCLLGDDIELMRKIPMRIDLPLETRELAVWHQDFHYVRGNKDIVTAWIPLQDTGFIEGCVSVMAGSHLLGAVSHGVSILGKRHMPDDSTLFERPVEYVPVRKGEAILMHSCLLHNGNVNLSDRIRFSMQARYTRAGETTDPEMGGVIPLS